MKRYYLSPVHGPDAFDDGYHAAITHYGVNVSAAFGPNPSAQSFVLCIVGAANQAPLLADNTLDALPDFPKDAKMSAMQNATKARFRQVLTRRGFDPAIADNADGYRDALRAIGQTFAPGFNEDSFDVRDQ